MEIENVIRNFVNNYKSTKTGKLVCQKTKTNNFQFISQLAKDLDVDNIDNLVDILTSEKKIIEYFTKKDKWRIYDKLILINNFVNYYKNIRNLNIEKDQNIISKGGMLKQISMKSKMEMSFLLYNGQKITIKGNFTVEINS